MSRILEKTEILDRIKEAYSLKTNAKLASFLGIAPTTLSSWYSRNTFDLDLIYEKCVDVNIEWLLTGQGSMFTSNSTGNTNNSGIQTIAGGNIGNGSVHITMPESGSQKIIDPSGKIEIQRTDSTKSEGTKEAELYKEIELMKQKVALMEDNMKMKDELIASLRDTIELLRNRQ